MEKTDYKITEFHNSEFGSIRMIEDGGRLLFSGIDVAFALGLSLIHIYIFQLGNIFFATKDVSA